MQPDIFKYMNSDLFVKDMTKYKIEQGSTYRSLSKRSGINSPNYIQQIIAGKRRLTPKMASKLAVGFQLDLNESRYLVDLVHLKEYDEPIDQQKYLTKLKSHIQNASKESIRADSIHSHWLHAIIWEAVSLKNFQHDIDSIREFLKNIASSQEIKFSIEFLEQRGWVKLNKKTGYYEQRQIKFEPSNDIKKLDIQQCHLKYLELAKRKITDPLDKREFQCVSISVPIACLTDIKAEMREFIGSLNDRYSGREDADTVINLHCSAICLSK